MKDLKSWRLVWISSAIGLVFAIGGPVVGSALAQNAGDVTLTPGGRIVTPQSTYRKYCGTCHGTDGKGNGPFAASLKVPPSDLTVLSKNNGGKFPGSHLYDVISGQTVIPAHGDPDAPIWGSRLRTPPGQRGPGSMSGPLVRTQKQIDEVINRIITYIESIQEK